MSGEVVILSGRRVMLCAPDGPPLNGERDLGDLLGEAYVQEVEVIVIPTARLGPGFLDLSTRIAGEILQKLINYRYRPVILGDISEALAGSCTGRSGATRCPRRCWCRRSPTRSSR